jgi:small subunit ribosomal protein S6
LDTVIKRTYEGMFLVDSGEAAADWQGTIGVIETVLSRSEAEAVTLKKWDERRLAYDINKKSRGTYILAYFDCDPLKIGSIERDVQLSEKITRVMILRTDRMSADDIAKPTPAMVVETEAARRAAAAAEKAAAAEAAAAEAAAAEAEPVAEEAEASVAEVVVDAPAEELPAEKPSEETGDQQ